VLKILPLILLSTVGCAVPKVASQVALQPVMQKPVQVSPSLASMASTDTEPNSGDMWLPEQIPSQADTLQRMGLRVDPSELADPGTGILGAIVNLNGCSASFVSPDGLIATNHHCAVHALEYNSTPERNLLESGFLAKTRTEEPSSGPSARAILDMATRDVTGEVRAALAQASDDLGREKAYETIEKQLVERCEQSRANLRCKLVSLYDGLRYTLFERLELRDVRIVWAPPEGIGDFGGEIDNWRWPRHTGDVAFFRAYIAKDGMPAPYSADNVPYRPAHWLKLASTALEVGEFVAVAGFPGRTARHKALPEVEDAMHWLYPRRLRMFDEYLAAFETLGAVDAVAKIKSVSWVRGFANVRTKYLGELEGMRRADLLTKKRVEVDRLRQNVASHPADIASYGAALEGIGSALAEYAKAREADTELEVEIGMPRLVSAANRIVRMAEERALPDAERASEYQERAWTALRDELTETGRLYHRRLDETVLRLALERALAIPAAQRTAALDIIAGQQPSAESIRRAVTALYANTKLADPKVQLGLFEKATVNELRKHSDPIIRLAVALRPLLRDAETRRKALAGKLLMLRPKYMEALLRLLRNHVAPDANGTLRLAFGVVRPEPPRADAKPSRAFTTLTEMLSKHQPKPPFVIPERLLRAAKLPRQGRFVDARLGDVPVNFLSDVNITNGNSGSATLNAQGEVVGLAFDGTYESVASDWMVLAETRSIHVDIRYVLWLLEQVEQADHLLRELDVTPGTRPPAGVSP